jgi:hypothetical protein
MRTLSKSTQGNFALGLVLLVGFAWSIESQTLNVSVSSTGRILSGGPSVEDARQALQNRIEQQAEGRIRLVSFNSTTTRAADVELDGRSFYQMEFTAVIEFIEPCRWAIRYGGRPLSFKCLKPSEKSQLAGEMPEHIIEIREKGERFSVPGSVCFWPGEKGWALAGFGSAGRPEKAFDAQAKACVTNLKQVGLAFRVWAVDHDDQYPFNLSTNAGGSRELCRVGQDGFDENAACHLRLLAQELGSPQLLVCPGDSARKAAASFQSLQRTNVSYLFRSGNEVNDTNTQEVLGRCPIHGIVLRADGTVQ